MDADEADRVLALRLEKIRMDRAAWIDGKFDTAQAAEEYSMAFAAGAVLMDEPPAVAARFRAAPIKEQLVAALDDWAWVAFFALRNDSLCERLLHIGRLTTPDSAWGDRIRQAKVWRDPHGLASLVQQAPGAQSPQLLVLIGSLLGYDHPLRESWSRQAADRYVADFWLNFELANALHEHGNLVEAAGCYRVALAVRPGSSVAWYNLGNTWVGLHKLPEAVAAYRNAADADPKNASAYNNLGNTLRSLERRPEAIDAFEKSIALRPKYAPAYTNLGTVLVDERRLTEGIAAHEKAIGLDPNDAVAHSNLGAALHELQKFPEAVAACRKAIELNSKYATAYNNLGNSLRAQRMLPEAIAAYHQAIKIDPKYATVYNNLGVALQDQRKGPDAIAAYQKAIELDPKDASAYSNLGSVLRDLKRPAEAIAACKKAVKLNPKLALAHYNLGVALHDLKQLPEAIAAYRKAIELNSKHAPSYNNLGSALQDQQKLSEAIDALHKAIEINPNYGLPHGGLGSILFAQGRFAEAAKAYQRGANLLPANHPRRPVYLNQLNQCQQLQALEDRLPAVLAGSEPAAPGELLQMARMCQEFKQRYTGAVQLYQQGFKAQPALAEDAAKHHRYRAACAAALAGTGQGDAAARLTEQEKAKLRQQARVWLLADLDRYAATLKDAMPEPILHTEQRLAHWQQDADLTGIRDAKLPEEEGKAWQTLWNAVAGLLKEARSRFAETRVEGTLTEKEKSKVQERKLVADRVYVIDLDSAAFDTFLKLEDAQGKLLAENDDVNADNLNSRLVFTAPADGVYRVIATSFEQAGVGPYTLRIREFNGGK